MRYLHLWAGALLLLAGIAAAYSWHALVVRSHSVADRDYRLDAIVTATPGGLLVDSLREGGDAERAGLRTGDRIEQVDHHGALSRADIDRALVARHRVQLRVRRAGLPLDIDITTHQT